MTKPRLKYSLHCQARSIIGLVQDKLFVRRPRSAVEYPARSQGRKWNVLRRFPRLKRELEDGVEIFVNAGFECSSCSVESRCIQFQSDCRRLGWAVLPRIRRNHGFQSPLHFSLLSFRPNYRLLLQILQSNRPSEYCGHIRG